VTRWHNNFPISIYFQEQERGMIMTAATMDRVWEIARQPAPEREYSGFPWWHALLVESNREERSANWLAKVHVHVYLPTFSKVVRRSRSVSMRRLCAAIPGMLFVPQEMMQISRRSEVFEYAHVRGYIRTADGNPKMLPKSDIELIRLMEAKLNLPPEAKGVFFKIGQRVRFSSDVYEAWGIGTVIEVAAEARIGVEVDRLFGRATKVYVPASEIEAI
jgi:transcription antitermination factor NusG